MRHLLRRARLRRGSEADPAELGPASSTPAGQPPSWAGCASSGHSRPMPAPQPRSPRPGSPPSTATRSSWGVGSAHSRRWTTGRPLPDGTKSPQSALVLIRGLFGFDGPGSDAGRRRPGGRARIRQQHTLARRGTLGTRVRRVCHRRCRARSQGLSEASRAPAAPSTIRVLALGTLSLCEAEQGNAALSARLADQAMDLVTASTRWRRIRKPRSPPPPTVHAGRAGPTGSRKRGRCSTSGLRARRAMPGLARGRSSTT